ncbi:MAG: hypothetical protein NZM35_05355 [Chitinophagales bacterium]|nr:hypothetical protein [Chitinophagales bacterium]MDW8418539.1 hypothetical protein [Chitinophagales bacterium]
MRQVPTADTPGKGYYLKTTDTTGLVFISFWVLSLVFYFNGVPPLLRFAHLRAAAGSGWLRGTLRSRAPLRYAPLPMVAPYASLTR